MAEEFGKDLELNEDELYDEDLMTFEDDIEEYDEEAAAKAAKRKKRIILIAGIAVGLAIAAALIAIFACRKKDD